ncbi:hypothetical protein COCSUDRAFT_57897 [Coccomyxa subellipsoidea C-169]|uniref:Uncharacterized protein n=1 Tax=Coccomyxa subellipsoidea (strain C-169) TaxID=574566 RepID=I0YP50_COCSC|nr:hypothetical protein COCSUDRAFT_57897 [Coccomyxa subellipsoidea C-169]EIE20169.1 hypothetical protein COCSUDRAFT_57897 [Coccomyxa subellipsoidea C-169]|eukprot:XP_005644713.1 hypothetical protein COCSUDRAFT_57897 [Coccomyxa subellipsoidea C-169]
MCWPRLAGSRVQRRAAELGVSPDKVSGDDVELGLFSFWETDNLDKELPAGVGKASSGRSRRKGVLMSEADAKKLREIRKGTPAQQEAERLYRTGQHPTSAELLHHLRRVDSF